MIVHMIGNAHIDPVWQWSWQAGVDEALATFRSAADRCDEYPEFIFTRGEAWLYRQVEMLDPDLFARVRQMIDRGQWHVTGGEVVQPDSNLPTAAGARRQIEHGRRYFQERFGVHCTVGYNVDSFGQTATLPDLLVSLGFTGYVFGRPDATQVALPATTVRWQGVGGGEIMAHRITPAYVTRTDGVYDNVMAAVAAADPALGHTMCFYGVGNHGGGPTKGAIEYIRDHAHALPGLELRFSTPAAFFAAITDKRDRLPLVTVELQHCFPGCYSVMHDIKQNQRLGEHLLSQAESLIQRFVDAPEERQVYERRLNTAWDDLLFTQFHDVLTGTSTPSAWGAVRAMQGRARIAGEEIALAITRRWALRSLPAVNAQQIVALNADAEPFEGFLEAEPPLDFDLWRDRWLSDLSGQQIPCQVVQAESPQMIHRVLFPAVIPSGGQAHVLVQDGPAPAVSTDTDLAVSPLRLANQCLSVDLGAGGIVQVRTGGRPLLGEGGVHLHLRHDHSDTWTLGTDRFAGLVETLWQTDGWTVEETGPLRARVRAEGWIGHSRLRWTLSLQRHDPRLFLQIEVTFAERFRLLQLPVHLAEAPENHLDGLAGGAVARANDGTEWPLQGWSRVNLGDQHLAMVTNDAYSLSLDGAIWQWTLLRSPKMAWMGDDWEGGGTSLNTGRAWHTDQGAHNFAFVLHTGESLPPAALERSARQMGQPPIVFDRYDGIHRPPWGNKLPRHLGGPEQG